MERDRDEQQSDDDADVQEINELADEFGDATATRSLTEEQMQRRLRELEERRD